MNKHGPCLKKRDGILTCKFPRSWTWHGPQHLAYKGLPKPTDQDWVLNPAFKGFCCIIPIMLFPTSSMLPKQSFYLRMTPEIWIIKRDLEGVPLVWRLCYSIVTTPRSWWPNGPTFFFSFSFLTAQVSYGFAETLSSLWDWGSYISLYPECCWSSGQQERKTWCSILPKLGLYCHSHFIR